MHRRFPPPPIPFSAATVSCFNAPPTHTKNKIKRMKLNDARIELATFSAPKSPLSFSFLGKEGGMCFVKET